MEVGGEILVWMDAFLIGGGRGWGWGGGGGWCVGGGCGRVSGVVGDGEGEDMMKEGVEEVLVIEQITTLDGIGRHHRGLAERLDERGEGSDGNLVHVGRVIAGGWGRFCQRERGVNEVESGLVRLG